MIEQLIEKLKDKAGQSVALTQAEIDEIIMDLKLWKASEDIVCETLHERVETAIREMK